MFTVVPAGFDKLDQMRARVQRCPKALGVVEFSGGYAFRCRREHAHSVRKELAPSALWTAMQARPGDQFWALKHVQVTTGPSQLSKAPQEAGWDVVALKPLGPYTWSVAASKAPPKSHIPLDGSFTIAVQANKPIVDVNWAHGLHLSYLLLEASLQFPRLGAMMTIWGPQQRLQQGCKRSKKRCLNRLRTWFRRRSLKPTIESMSWLHFAH